MKGKPERMPSDRPAFYAEDGGYSSKKDNIRYVLVFKLSRFARNTEDLTRTFQGAFSEPGLWGSRTESTLQPLPASMIANIMGLSHAEVELESIQS